jgi:hypothetical protein
MGCLSSPDDCGEWRRRLKNGLGYFESLYPKSEAVFFRILLPTWGEGGGVNICLMGEKFLKD